MKKRLIKILLLILFFAYPSFCFADQYRIVSKYSMEGISIGDSLLKFFSLGEIKKNINWNYYSYIKDKRFINAMFTSPSFKKYNQIQVHFKRNDKDYIVHAIGGVIYYEDKISKCYKRQEKDLESLRLEFKDMDIEEAFTDIEQEPNDTSGESFYRTYGIFFNSFDLILRIDCYDWSPKMKPYQDNYRITVTTVEFDNWLLLSDN